MASSVAAANDLQRLVLGAFVRSVTDLERSALGDLVALAQL